MLVEVPLSLKFCILRFVYHTHAGFPDFFDDFVMKYLLTNQFITLDFLLQFVHYNVLPISGRPQAGPSASAG